LTRMSLLNSPFLLGFDSVERALDRAAKSSGDGYPPYNIERVANDEHGSEAVRITLAVAGFTRDDLEVLVEDNQLIVRGRQTERQDRVYLHRGIAARQFSRAFVLAEGVEVAACDLANGLLSVDLTMPRAGREAKRIEIGERK
jgi:HSP20 family molecular chaperone IbpA